MADEVDMTPVAAEPPKADPLAKPASSKPATLRLTPVIRKPAAAGATAALKPGLKLPPKPGISTSGLKLPTQTALKPGLKLPPKPVIRKPGSTIAASPLPKPVTPPVAAKPAAPAPAAAAPTPIDQQGVAKLPTVSMKPVSHDAPAPAVSPNPKPMEALKSVTQKLKGITQQIPQQAILRKTGIIADASLSEAQKEAAKHKTARISLSDAIGISPVKDENAPMKTIRIRRPVDIPGATSTKLSPAATPAPAAPAEATAAAAADAAKGAAAPDKPAEPSVSMTQRKTLKIARPGGGAVRPTGKFSVKRPSAATTVAKRPAPDAAAPASAEVADMPVADIPDIPADIAPIAAPQSAPASWVTVLSAVVQAAACVTIGVLAWMLFQNTQIAYF